MNVQILFAVLLTGIIAVSGCTQGPAAKSGFTISSPSEGGTVSEDVMVKVSPSNFKIAPPADKNVAGEGHFHFYLDGGTYIPVASDSYEFKDLSPGTHSVKIDMHNNDHSSLGVSKTVSFTVVPSIGFSATAMVKGIEAVISLSAANFNIVPPSDTNKEGEGHFHFFLDGGTYIPVASSSYTFENLSAGNHTVRIEMKNNDHSDLGISKTISFAAPDFTPSVSLSGTTATIDLQVSGFEIVPPSETLESNKGHFHFFLDGGNYIPVANSTYTFDNLAAGNHTVKIEMKNNDHSDAGIAKTVTFNTNEDYSASVLLSGNKVTVTLVPNNFKIVAPSSTNAPGEGHFHFYLNGGTYIPVASSSYTFENLSTGSHTVKIEMKENDHSDKGNTKTVKFKVPSFSATASVAGSAATIKITTTNFNIVPPSETLESNKGHFHFFLDGGNYIPVANSTYTFDNLAAGNHTVKIEMKNNDHSDAGIAKTLSLTIGSGY